MTFTARSIPRLVKLSQPLRLFSRAYCNIRILNNSVHCNILCSKHSLPISRNVTAVLRCMSNDTQNNNNKSEEADPKKLGLVARFKQMYRDYWYVLIPVHLITSTVWFGCFYFIAKGGVDIVQLLTWIGLSEYFTEPLKSSSAGYFALAYALYKVATPLRYTVTIGGTTLTINFLRQRGYLKPKPIPSRDKLKEIYTDKKHELVQKTNQMREKKDTIKEDLKRYRQKIRDIKESEVKTK